MFTVNEVAELLNVTPYTVRKMLRQGRLSGFRAGKSWRITESALLRDIDRMKGHRVPSIPSEAACKEEPPLIAQVAQPPNPPKEPNLNANAKGHLLVFSDIPGQEVFVDGERRGVTTLTISKLPVGVHELRVGDAKGSVEVYEEFQTRVRVNEGKLQILSRPNNEKSKKRDNIREFLIRIFLDNDADFPGPLQIDLSSGGTVMKGGGGTTEKTGEDDPMAQTISSSVTRAGLTTLFAGRIQGIRGCSLTILVPTQPGLPKKAEKTFIVESDLDITLRSALVGRFRSKWAISFDLGAIL